MLLRLCQLKSLSILALALIMASGCSWRKNNVDSSYELLTTFSNRWFSVNPNHSITDLNGQAVPHIAFDTTPEFDPKARTVNVVITTPKDSPYAYAIDMSSGQRYYHHSYCKQTDVWQIYGGTINRPPFYIGHIPRVLDQIGEPQKIIIWSNRDKFQETATSNFHKVKLVGAYVEQLCREGNCLGKSNWISRMVFVGVDADDKNFVNISSIEDLKNEIDWTETKAYLENLDGRNHMGDKSFPALRVSQLIEYDDSFDYFKKRSIFMTDSELKKIQKGCHALYDRLWEEVGKPRPEDLPATTMDELNRKIKLKESLRAQKVPVGFASRFGAFTRNYYNEISTCDRFVYHGNVNKNQEVFWFLSHVGLFYRLHRDGYYYDCRHKAWLKNVLNEEGNPINNIKRDISECKDADIDQAMSYLPNFLKGLKSEKEFYKFLEYDHHKFGTKQKLYSWVKVNSRRFDCEEDPNVLIRKETRIFPEEIKWEPRHVKDIADKLKIIY